MSHLRPGRRILPYLLIVTALAGFWLALFPAAAHADSPVFVRPAGDDLLCDGFADVDYSPAVAPACALASTQHALAVAQPGDNVVVTGANGEAMVLPLPPTDELSVAAVPLAITKTGSSASVEVFEPLTYTIRITNISGATINTWRLVDVLPPEGTIALKSFSPSAGCVFFTPDLIRCEGGPLANGASSVVTVVVTTTAVGAINNTVLGSSVSPNITDTVTVVELTDVSGDIDLAIAKSDSPDPVVAGQPLTYTITITNNGPDPAASVVVTDSLPATLLYNNASSGCVPPGGGVITCTAPFLGIGQSVSFTVWLTTTEAGLITNTARISGGGIDPDPTNNVATQTTTISHPGFAIAKSANPPHGSAVDPGDRITYTVVLANNFGATTGLTLADAIPAGTTYVPGSASGGFVFGGTSVVLAAPTFANNTTVTATFQVTVTTNLTTTLSNVASAVSDQTSLQASNTVTHAVRGTAVTGPIYLPVILKGYQDPYITLYWDDVEPVRDKVSDTNASPAWYTPDGNTDGLFKMVVNPGSRAITVTHVLLESSAGFSWDTNPATGSVPALGVFIGSAIRLNANDGSITQSVPFALTVTLYGSDDVINTNRFIPQQDVYTATVTLSDGSTLLASTMIPPAGGGGTTPPPEPMSNISDVKVDPDTNQVFVASPRYDVVYVIDGSTDTLTRTVPVGNGPTGLTVLQASVPANNKVFAAHQYGANFWQPGVKAFGVGESASHDTDFGGYVGAAPIKIAANGITGRVYVSNFFDKLAVLDGASAPPEARLGWVLQKGWQASYGIDVSEATNRVYLATRDTGELVVFNGAGDRLLAADFIPTHVKPPQACALWSVAVNETTGHVFVPCPALSTVFVLQESQVTVNALESLGVLEQRPDGLALVVAAVSAPWIAEVSVPGETGLGEEGIAVDPTTNRVFITNARNNTVVVLQDGATPAYDTSVAVGVSPQGLDVNPATQKVYVGNTGSATITVLQATSPYSTVTTITP